jgi:predicted nicotinamide N-methyase
MLRLRFLSEFPSHTDTNGAISFSMHATNESGGTQTLFTPLELSFRLCSALDGTPLREGDGGLLLRGGGFIGPSGEGSISLSVRCARGGCAGAREVRVEVSPSGGAPARVVPASVPRGELAGRKWVPTQDVDVSVVCTPAFRVGGGGGCGGGGGGGAALHVLPNGLKIFERHTTVISGFGTIVWDAALVAAVALPRVLAPPPPRGRGAAAPPLRGLRAVDLACGTGFLGISAAALGAAVTLTDGLPAMLPVARENAALNRAAVERAGGALDVAACAWGEPVGHLQGPFDLVLASEAVFSQEQFAPFVATLRALVTTPRTRLLLAVRRRACCELDDLLVLLGEHFDMEEGALGEKEAAMVQQAATLSKTEFAPQLRVLRAKTQAVPGANLAACGHAPLP